MIPALLNLAHLLAVLRSLLFLQVPASTKIVLPTVNLSCARYQGAIDIVTNTTSFLGIRYAAAPVGNLRWAAPQPPPTLHGVQQTTAQPDECYQAPTGRSPTNPLNTSTKSKRTVAQSEDCLFLSVYTPGHTVIPVKSGGLPVLVWIHGGGYVSGSESQFNGADLIVESNHGLIVVTIQYRLGLFGFLAGEAVKSGGAPNAGLLDQNYALQWVQSHIATFGGDPMKVSIWGISAGAGSVLQHVIAHGGNTQPPLFRAAITSSSYLPPQYNYNDRIPELLYSEVVSGANCTSSPDTLSCLRAANINTLEYLNNKINYDAFYGTYTFVPVVDGVFIIARPTVALAEGKVNGEALYSVTNSHEGNIFVDQSATLNISHYINTLFPNIQAWQVAAAVPLYEGLGTNVDQANYVMGESIFVCPTYYLLETFGRKAWKVTGESLLFHQVTMAKIKGTTLQGNATSEFITAFSNRFLAMTISLDPSDKYNASDITPTQWNAWSNGHTEMMFNVTSSGTPDVYTYATDSALLNRCAYWRSIAENTAQ
ncbi:Alpha/Beta hydrolase protein [Lanmaoa asiatica]|nr:Alpha/Beta hydrolase protein [Lanmaoa asiatica]